MESVVVEFPNPSDAFSFDEDGLPVEVGSNKAKQLNSAYWDSQLKKVALVGMFSALILVFTLLNESRILQVAWDWVLATVGGLFGMIFSPYIDAITGFLPK